MKRRSYIGVVSFILFFFIVDIMYAQVSAPGAAGSAETSYASFPGTDSIFVFCAEKEGVPVGELKVSTGLSGTKTFLWEMYNNFTASFDFYFSESSLGTTSSISGLADGCYRATVTQGGTVEVYRAWVFNTWIIAEASVSESNCESFILNGSLSYSEINYYDLADNTSLSEPRDINVQWKDGDDIVARVQSPQVFDPPSSNTDYTLRVYDRFGCEETVSVTYESIVTKAAFEADPMEGEAPLDVTFTNNSENGDEGSYEWSLFRDLNEIKEEAEKSQEEIDSIMLNIYDDNLVYTYESSGTYMVKLVSKHYVNDTLTCTDTAYLDDYISVDSSFISAPNVFTPNGDGTNDEFIVKFWSMMNIKISIFNRWGKKIHYWSKSNIQGFEDTYAESVWDGKIGGRYASPGVYYYFVEGRGRDGTTRRTNGFVHLFRGRD